MEKVEVKQILITLDGDGVLFRGGLPVKTAFSIFRGSLDTPPKVEQLEPFKKPTGKVASAWMAYMNLYNRLVPFNGKAVEALGLIKHLGIYYRGTGQINVGVLSGREPAFHKSTLTRLKEPKIAKYISPEFIFLNPSNNVQGFKQYQVRAKMKEGFSVIHIDNDLLEGLSISRVGQEFSDGPQLHVYVLNCLAYHKRLLSQLREPTPENLEIMNSFSRIIADIDSKIAAGQV